ncbi:MAG TPA: M28 family metallopeptidase [Tahibacter sp.]|uniref:M28 family metallopeptidase n=1 Tax=Tahibacter sp. TaxID=2056211 RepID=UPI002CA74315|nr:M28 family metallopeptidase [Tahibacter sp.]HSX62209.1 M28 family metallopeptidase [Tahibacter sp.]
MRHVFVIASAALTLAACSEAPPPAAPTAATAAPKTYASTFAGSGADFADRLKKLSSDEFEGREPGTLGERLTTAYIKDQFERAGLKPGNNGSWFQSVPTVEIALQNTDVTLDIAVGGGKESFAYKTDMVVGNLSAKPDVAIKDSELVFVGYGVNAPEQDWNDYAGLDVKGKTVVVLVNDPGFGNNDAALFKGRAMTYYGRWTYKFEEAARQGAAAALIVHETEGAGYGWGVVENSWSGPQFDLPASEDPAPRLDAAGWITKASAERLFAKAGLDFAALRKSADVRGFKPQALPAKLTTTLKSTIKSGSSDNVVAMLPGAGKPDEAIVYSAHWDHLGKDPTRSGDQIFNGAVDNATGVAGLIVIAEAFAKQNPPPARSVVFAAVTLEESGLLGSRYYAAHPPIPMDKTVANINMDALYLAPTARNMAVVGFGQSELDAYLKDAAASQGRVITAEESPEKGHFFRSDHFNFARKGVPALYAKGGTDLFEGGQEAGRAAFDDYGKNRYHQVADEFKESMPIAGAVADLEALYKVGSKLAGESTWPQWAADSEFKAARDASKK